MNNLQELIHKLDDIRVVLDSLQLNAVKINNQLDIDDEQAASAQFNRELTIIKAGLGFEVAAILDAAKNFRDAAIDRNKELRVIASD